MNIAFVDFYGESKTDKHVSGVERKMQAQIKALSAIGSVTRHSYETQTNTKVMKYLRMITRRLPFFPSKIAYHYDSTYDGIDTLYFRRTTLDSYAVRFFRDIRRHNPSCKIVMELPTYPYDKEMSSFIEYPRLWKDRWNRRKLKRYIDRIVTFSDDDEIFGIPTIKTMNGIDFETVPLRKVAERRDDTIHAVMVANFAPWHGVDRILEGMKRYKPNQQHRTFILHIVGGGYGIDKLVRFIELEQLSESVVFHGPLPFDSLHAVYDECSIAINSLGAHKIGLYKTISTIKTREYGAKGLPIVSSIRIDYFEESSPYVLLVSADDSPVEIEKIIEFHDKLYKKDADAASLATEIRTYAESRCSDTKMMEPVIEFFLSKS